MRKAAALLFAGVFASSAWASVDVQTFTPAAGTTYVFTEDALMQVAPGDDKWTGERLYFHLLYNYDDEPLVEFNDSHTSRTSVLVNSFNTLDMGVGILPLKNLMFSVNFPMNLVSIPGSGEQFALGDTQLQMKWRVTDDDAPVAVAIVPELRLPSGDSNLFLSDGGVGEGIGLAIERDFGPFRASGNIGYRHNAGAEFEDIDYGNQIAMSIGVFVPIDSHWGIDAEADGALSLPANQYNNPGEFYAGGRYQISEDASVLLGASTGSIGGGGSGDYRVIAGVKFSPMDALSKPKPAPVAYRPAPAPVVRAQPIPPRVIFTAKEIKISENVNFEFNKDTLTASGRNLLDEVAKVIRQNMNRFRKIRIEGHTDHVGGDAYNMKLSGARATSVLEYLVGRGIPRGRLESVGYGKRRPKAPKNISLKAQDAINRRVEFKVLH